MPNYAASRTHMVESQIHPLGVISPSILKAFQTVPREMFVPESVRGIAYADDDLRFDDGRVLMEPALLARMIESIAIRPDDIVLNIGDMTGYSSAILSSLALRVITPEAVAGTLDQVRGTWTYCGCGNIDVIAADAIMRDPGEAPYSVIFMNGAVAERPDGLLAHLSLRGRMIVVMKPPGAKPGTVTEFERDGTGEFSTRKIFDADTHYIPGFDPRPGFVF